MKTYKEMTKLEKLISLQRYYAIQTMHIIGTVEKGEKELKTIGAFSWFEKDAGKYLESAKSIYKKMLRMRWRSVKEFRKEIRAHGLTHVKELKEFKKK